MLNKKIIKYTSRLSFHSPWFIILIFSSLGLIGILNHSMWRDELNPWLIVRDSESFGDLITNIHYEGHPHVEQSEILSQINFILKNQDEQKKILLILNQKLNVNRNDLKIVPIKDFERSWTSDELYYLYWVDEA
ncbi:MAG: hypothetical protein V7L11_22000 [Nostoc sp.]|uniref:hypothetical protein n=1 Tax=Nostoc sp. TaxID=1180 RepID=UPI002FF6E2D9